MMDEFSSEVNDALNLIYTSVRRVEEKMLRSSVLNLTTSELDFIHAIGKHQEGGCSISDIARDNQVTLPTVTVAIKKLEAKGYVEKLRSTEDGRMVKVVLTKLGHKAYAVHRYFHERMVRSLLRDVDESIKPVFLDALNNLGAFLKKIGGVP